MKKTVLFVITFFFINTLTKAQNTTFNNVSIGSDGPAYGIKIKANLPNLTEPWARGFYVSNETGNQNYISLGSLGYVTNGVTTVTNSYIGTDYNHQYMTFLPNGNIGVGTANPQSVLQIGEFGNNSNYKLSLPGVYNFEEIKLGQYGNGINGLEMITHTNVSNSFGVRLYAGTDTGMNGLLIQTANPTNSLENLNYTTKLAINLEGNVGIGTIHPTSKLTVAGNISSREVKVTVDAGADFVFEDDYNLPSLESVAQFIKKNKHLPEIASAKEMQKDGINLSEMNIKLLQKMEEMTLYMIEMKKENDLMKKENQEIKKDLLKLKTKSK